MNEPNYELKFHRFKLGAGWSLMITKGSAQLARADLFRGHPKMKKELGDWLLDLYFNPKEDMHFRKWLKKQGKEPRHLWEELSIHLANWHKRVGGGIHYGNHAPYLPKGFMHPRYSNMEPSFKTPKELELRSYQKPNARRIPEKKAKLRAFWFGKLKPRSVHRK